MKNKVRLKTMTDQDIFERQEESSKGSVPEIFLNKRDEFYERLLKLEFDPRLIQRILDNGIPAPDINLVIELAQNFVNNKVEPHHHHVQAGADSEDEIQYLEEGEEGAEQIDHLAIPNAKPKATPKIKWKKYNVRPRRDPDYDIPKPKVRHYEMDYLFPPSDPSVFNQQSIETNRPSPLHQTTAVTLETSSTHRSKQDNPVQVIQVEDSNKLSPTMKKPLKKKYTFISKPPADYLNLLSPDKFDVSSDVPLCLNCNTTPICIVISIILLAINLYELGISPLRTCCNLQTLLE